MISGVRASSIRMLSTSSTIAKRARAGRSRSSARRHVVAQVVEAELGVGPVGDVGRRTSGGAAPGPSSDLDHADGDAERVVDRLHPIGVAAGQVVVDGDEVDAVAGERVEEDGAGSRSASCPRRSSSRRSRRRAGPCRRSAGRRSGAGRASACPPRGTSAKASGSRSSSDSPSSRARSRSSSASLADLGVVEQLHLGLEAVDRLDALLVFLELLRLAEAQRAVDESPCHRVREYRTPSHARPYAGCSHAPARGDAAQASRPRIWPTRRRVAAACGASRDGA